VSYIAYLLAPFCTDDKTHATEIQPRQQNVSVSSFKQDDDIFWDIQNRAIFHNNADVTEVLFNVSICLNHNTVLIADVIFPEIRG
jgi:hypothetical protein